MRSATLMVDRKRLNSAFSNILFPNQRAIPYFRKKVAGRFHFRRLNRLFPGKALLERGDERIDILFGGEAAHRDAQRAVGPILRDAHRGKHMAGR